MRSFTRSHWRCLWAATQDKQIKLQGICWEQMPANCLTLGWHMMTSTALPIRLQVVEEAKLCQACMHIVASEALAGSTTCS